LICRNRISAGVLAVALLCAPFTPAIEAARAVGLQQGSDVPTDAEQAMFTKGQNFFLQGRYEPAVGVLKDFLKTYPNSIITDLTLLWLGRSYMQLGKLQDAQLIGKRLRAIRDTPFADIYDGELQTAQREAVSRGSATMTAVADNRNGQGTPGPRNEQYGGVEPPTRAWRST
jgi:tetratricopeptide (TPR) repeat protein